MKVNEKLAYFRDNRDNFKEEVLAILCNKFDITKEEAEGAIWDYLSTEKGWDNITSDIKKQLGGE